MRRTDANTLVSPSTTGEFVEALDVPYTEVFSPEPWYDFD